MKITGKLKNYKDLRRYDNRMKEIILNLTLKEILDYIINPLFCSIFLIKNLINIITYWFAKKKKLIKNAEKSLCFNFIFLFILELIVEKEIIFKTFISIIITDILITILRLGINYYNFETRIKKGDYIPIK